MATIQERQAQKRLYVDAWSTREKLCLASAVLRSGDQNWNAVSRTIKPNADANRPMDWMVPKACAVQYQILLDSVETPKRKKRVAGEKLVESSETAAEYLVRKLTQDHQEDLKKRMDFEKREYFKVKSELEAIESGSFAEEDLDKLIAEMDLEDENRRLKEEEYKRFLIDREQKKRDYERPLWKSPSVAAAQAASPHKSNLSDKLNESSTSEGPEVKPSSTPTSPLLTSLLQSPSPLQRSSVLSATPTISNLLNSAPAIPHYSTDSPTLTKLLESRTSPRANPVSLAESSISNKTDLQHKQMMSTSPSVTSHVTESSSHLVSSPRINRSPVGRMPSRSDIISAPLRVDSNPDISSVVRCLYMEDIMDKKARVGIEKTQLLLNQANVDLSKVDEQKLQDEIVDMIVEQQETDGMNISALSQSNVNNPTVTTSASMPTAVKIEVSEAQPSSDTPPATIIEDSKFVDLTDPRESGARNSRFTKEAASNDDKITIKIEDDIPIEIAGNSPASTNKTNTELIAQTTVPLSIDVETTQTMSLSQAEISIVGISPIKTEPAEVSSEKPSEEMDDVTSSKEESKSTQRKEKTKEEFKSESISSDVVNSHPTSKSSKSSDVKTPIVTGTAHVPLKEALIKIGRVDESDTKRDENEKDVKDENVETINFNQNVIILDADLDLNAENIQSSGDIIIDNDTEVIIAKDEASAKSDEADPEISEIAVSEPVKEDVECIGSSELVKPEDKKVSLDDVGRNSEDSESDSPEISDIMKDSGKWSEDKDTNVKSVRGDTSKRPTRPDSGRRVSKSSNEKTDIETKEIKRSASTVVEKKVTRPSSEKKEILKKGADDDEDEIVNDGDDEDDSDEQILSSLKKSGLSSEKRQSATRKKSSGTAPTGIIPPVSDFVDTSSDTHSTGGDDSESTSMSFSATPRLNKKTNAREKRDSVNSTTSSSHEEKELRAWKKSIMLVYNRIATHKFASLFLKPITEDQAPGYHKIVKQPIDLLTIKKNVENGTLRTTLDFQRAVMLMFTNALFFNWCGSDIYKMTKEMMMDTLNHIQLLVQTMGEGMPYAQSETESPEKQVRAERIKRAVIAQASSITPTPSVLKRKRSGMETPPMIPTGGTDAVSSPVVKRRR